MVLEKTKNSLKNQHQSISSLGLPTIFFKNKNVLSLKTGFQAPIIPKSKQFIYALNNRKKSLFSDKLSSTVSRMVLSNEHFGEPKLQISKILKSHKLEVNDTQKKNLTLNLKRSCINRNQTEDYFCNQSNFILLNEEQTSGVALTKRLKKSPPKKHIIRQLDKEFTLRDETFLDNPFLFENSPTVRKIDERSRSNIAFPKNIKNVLLNIVNSTVSSSCKNDKIIAPIVPTVCLSPVISYKTKSISELIYEIDKRLLCLSSHSNVEILSSRTMEQRIENVKRLLGCNLSESNFVGTSEDSNFTINRSTILPNKVFDMTPKPFSVISEFSSNVTKTKNENIQQLSLPEPTISIIGPCVFPERKTTDEDETSGYLKKELYCIQSLDTPSVTKGEIKILNEDKENDILKQSINDSLSCLVSSLGESKGIPQSHNFTKANLNSTLNNPIFGQSLSVKQDPVSSSETETDINIPESSLDKDTFSVSKNVTFNDLFKSSPYLSSVTMTLPKSTIEYVTGSSTTNMSQSSIMSVFGENERANPAFASAELSEMNSNGVNENICDVSKFSLSQNVLKNSPCQTLPSDPFRNYEISTVRDFGSKSHFRQSDSELESVKSIPISKNLNTKEGYFASHDQSVPHFAIPFKSQQSYNSDNNIISNNIVDQNYNSKEVAVTSSPILSKQTEKKSQFSYDKKHRENSDGNQRFVPVSVLSDETLINSQCLNSSNINQNPNSDDLSQSIFIKNSSCPLSRNESITSSSLASFVQTENVLQSANTFSFIQNKGDNTKSSSTDVFPSSKLSEFVLINQNKIDVSTENISFPPNGISFSSSKHNDEKLEKDQSAEIFERNATSKSSNIFGLKTTSSGNIFGSSLKSSKTSIDSDLHLPKSSVLFEERSFGIFGQLPNNKQEFISFSEPKEKAAGSVKFNSSAIVEVTSASSDLSTNIKFVQSMKEDEPTDIVCIDLTTPEYDRKTTEKKRIFKQNRRIVDRVGPKSYSLASYYGNGRESFRDSTSQSEDSIISDKKTIWSNNTHDKGSKTSEALLYRKIYNGFKDQSPDGRSPFKITFSRKNEYHDAQNVKEHVRSPIDHSHGSDTTITDDVYALNLTYDNKQSSENIRYNLFSRNRYVLTTKSKDK